MSYPDKATTENEQLRARLNWAEAELHRIDMESVRMAIQRMDRSIDPYPGRFSRNRKVANNPGLECRPAGTNGLSGTW